VNAIDFIGVSKSYSVYKAPHDRLKELLTINALNCHTDFWALRDVSFAVGGGETFCVIGDNGSGKSTLLQLVAGILQPTTGRTHVQGRVAALLELGSGFNPEFTGRENVFLNASILGLSAKQIEQKLDQILAFAEIGHFIDEPTKTYSSGMTIRLAFAIAVHVEPKLLVVDEALAVGDAYFRQRCLREIHQLRQRGVSIVFVSHAMGDVNAIGDRCLWLEKGCVRELGETSQVVAHYLAATEEQALESAGNLAVTAEGNAAPIPLLRLPNIDDRCGNGRARIIGVAVLNADHHQIHLLAPADRVIIRISAYAHTTLAAPRVGFALRNRLGIDFAGTSSDREGAILPSMQEGESVTVDFHILLPELYASDFSFSPFISDGPDGSVSVCDRVENAYVLPMGRGDAQVYGYLHVPCRVELNGRIDVEEPVQ
jgi:lipopolysaccharide transport system ATP-binding protein